VGCPEWAALTGKHQAPACCFGVEGDDTQGGGVPSGGDMSPALGGSPAPGTPWMGTGGDRRARGPSPLPLGSRVGVRAAQRTWGDTGSVAGPFIGSRAPGRGARGGRRGQGGRGVARSGFGLSEVQPVADPDPPALEEAPEPLLDPGKKIPEPGRPDAAELGGEAAA